MIRRVESILKILGLAAFLALPGCAGVLHLDDAHALVPFRIDDAGRIVVEAHVDGHGPYDFVLDTAATISSVFDSVRDELALESVPGQSVTVHGVVASGKYPLLDIERLELGSEIWAEPRIVSLPGKTAAGTSVDGVLGVDFLRRYAVGFSAGDRVVRLYPPTLVALRSYRGWASVPLRAEPIGNSRASVYFIDVSIDGWEIRAVFDVGAGFNMINWPGARSLGTTARALRKNAVVSGALGRSREIARLEAREVTTASIRWRNEVFLVADVEVFETLLLQYRPAAILGAGLFTQRDFVIDFVRNRLLVKVAMDEVSVPVSTGNSH